MATTTEWLRLLKNEGVKTEDAKEKLFLTITKRDTKGAIPGSCKHCVLAKWLKKQPRVAGAHIFNKVAHVLKFDPKTELYVNFRYSLDQKVRDAIQAFDDKKPFPTGDYVFHPLIRSERSKEKKKRDDKRAKRSSGKKKLESPPVLRKGSHLRKFKDEFVGL